MTKLSVTLDVSVSFQDSYDNVGFILGGGMGIYLQINEFSLIEVSDLIDNTA